MKTEAQPLAEKSSKDNDECVVDKEGSNWTACRALDLLSCGSGEQDHVGFEQKQSCP